MQLKLGIIKQTNKNSEFNSYYFRLLHNTTMGLASEKDLTNSSNSVAKSQFFSFLVCLLLSKLQTILIQSRSAILMNSFAHTLFQISRKAADIFKITSGRLHTILSLTTFSS